jgi:hypothetical protein
MMIEDHDEIATEMEIRIIMHITRTSGLAEYLFVEGRGRISICTINLELLETWQEVTITLLHMTNLDREEEVL